jgi:hypothetical protein
MDDPMVSAMECKQLLKDEATSFVLYSIDDVRKTLTQLENTTSQEEFQHVLQAFAEVFDEPQGLPPHRSADHEIPLLPGPKPPNIRLYRMSYNQKNTIEKTIAQLLKNGEIQPSTSPFSSPLILVRKKDKRWRLCVDFRGLNDLTVKNKFPIPVIEDLLDELHGATIFSKIDLRSGYHQIRMKEEDVHKTGFSTHLGHYEYLVMPFGLSNALATFQQLMNQIFAKYLRKFVLVFFDDILVYSPSKEQHKLHLQAVLQVLKDNQLKAKLEKCTFGQPSVEYLGHIISGQGVATDPAKIKDIVEWKTPKTLKKLRGFLGLTGYYRRFIKGYSTICQPLYHALKKDNFQWGQQQEEAFQKLKTIMSTPPMLKLPDFTIPFVLETDTCKSGLGAVLMQEGRPIAFFSQCLCPKTDAMSVYEKEALAILHALEKWRHY